MPATKLRNKLVTRSQPLLPPNSNVRQVFQCQTGPSPYWFLLTYLVLPWIKYRIVCVTDDAIYVIRANKLVPSFPKELIETVPRDQQLGPVSGLWAPMQLLGERHWVAKRFHKDIEAADSRQP